MDPSVWTPQERTGCQSSESQSSKGINSPIFEGQTQLNWWRLFFFFFGLQMLLFSERFLQCHSSETETNFFVILRSPGKLKKNLEIRRCDFWQSSFCQPMNGWIKECLHPYVTEFKMWGSHHYVTFFHCENILQETEATLYLPLLGRPECLPSLLWWPTLHAFKPVWCSHCHTSWSDHVWIHDGLDWTHPCAQLHPMKKASTTDKWMSYLRTMQAG